MDSPCLNLEESTLAPNSEIEDGSEIEDIQVGHPVIFVEINLLMFQHYFDICRT